jgi:hypothetical protein
MKKIFIAILLVTPMILSAQKQETEDLYTHWKISTFDLRSRDLKGSMFINEEPELAKITESEKLYAMRFNAYVNEMEFERDGQSFFLHKRLNYSVVFQSSGKTYRVFGYDNKGTTDLGFFVLLHEGKKISLLAMERIEYLEQKAPTTGYDKFRPPTLKRKKDVYYIGYPNGTTSELPTKKKEILKLFANKATDVDSFARKNKLSYKKGKDLQQLFAYYDSIN